MWYVMTYILSTPVSVPTVTPTWVLDLLSYDRTISDTSYSLFQHILMNPLIKRFIKGSLHHTDPSDDVPLDTCLSSEDVDLNGTVVTPTFKGRCVIGTPLPRSSPHTCNVTGVSRGRIPITVHLMRLHVLGPLRTRSTLVYL